MGQSTWIRKPVRSSSHKEPRPIQHHQQQACALCLVPALSVPLLSLSLSLFLLLAPSFLFSVSLTTQLWWLTAAVSASSLFFLPFPVFPLSSLLTPNTLFLFSHVRRCIDFAFFAQSAGCQAYRSRSPLFSAPRPLIYRRQLLFDIPEHICQSSLARNSSSLVYCWMPPRALPRSCLVFPSPFFDRA